MRISGGLRNQARMFTSGLRHLVSARREPEKPKGVGGRIRALFSHGDEGGALIEIALTVPVLLGLVTGICTFGIAFSNQLSLTQAVGVAGQYLSQIRSTSTNPCADAFTALKNAAPNLTSSSISMTVIMNGTTPTQTGNSCSGAQTNLVQGSSVSVQATYPCTLAIYGLRFASGCQLSAKVTEYEY
jgi:Flp pilus assembly protein TadG